MPATIPVNRTRTRLTVRRSNEWVDWVQRMLKELGVEFVVSTPVRVKRPGAAAFMEMRLVYWGPRPYAWSLMTFEPLALREDDRAALKNQIMAAMIDIAQVKGRTLPDTFTDEDVLGWFKAPVGA